MKKKGTSSEGDNQQLEENIRSANRGRGRGGFPSRHGGRGNRGRERND